MMKLYLFMAICLFIISCDNDTQQQEFDPGTIEKKDAIFYNVETFRDSLNKVIVKTSYEAYVGDTVTRRWVNYDTLPDLGKETVEFKDEEDNDKSMIVSKPYQIFFREINHKERR